MTLAQLDLPPDVDPLLASLDERRQSLEDAAREYAREVQTKVRTLLGSLARFEEGCQILFQEVLAGKVLDVAVRDRFLGAFERRMVLMNKAHGLALHAGKMAGYDLPEADPLAAEADALSRKLTRLANRWRTAEDLEDLAAESIEVAPEKVQAIRERHGFPQAWYDGHSEPF